MIRSTVLILALLSPGMALAQQSASHQLEEHVFNCGGSPSDGAVLSSSSHEVTLSSVGRGIPLAAASSASFLMSAGFVSAYPPPGEVVNVRFADPTTLAWDADLSAGGYNLYQGGITSPFDSGYGACSTTGITTLQATVSSVPALNEGIFLLVTAENRLLEEGTKGADSAGLRRDNSNPCP